MRYRFSRLELSQEVSMSRGRVGATSGIVRRKALKPRKPLTDEQLLASAQRAADRAAKQLERERRAERDRQSWNAQDRAVRGARTSAGQSPSDAEGLKVAG